MVAEFVCLCGGVVVVVVFAFGVFAFDFDGGYGITDCGVKWGECPVGRGLSADLAVVMTEYRCTSVSCARDFLLKNLNDEDAIRGRNCDDNFGLRVGH